MVPPDDCETFWVSEGSQLRDRYQKWYPNNPQHAEVFDRYIIPRIQCRILTIPMLIQELARGYYRYDRDNPTWGGQVVGPAFIKGIFGILRVFVEDARVDPYRGSICRMAIDAWQAAKTAPDNP